MHSTVNIDNNIVLICFFKCLDFLQLSLYMGASFLKTTVKYNLAKQIIIFLGDKNLDVISNHMHLIV